MDIDKPVIVKIKDTLDALNTYEEDLKARPEGTKERTCILDYPAVYIHARKQPNGKYQAYVGESIHVFDRTREHYDLIADPMKWQHEILNQEDSELFLIGHLHFNKSLTLDVENKLMHFLSAVDCVEKVENERSNEQGMYYTSDEFPAIFDRIWNELNNFNKKLFPDKATIADSAIFKSSPFHKLFPDQEDAKAKIKYLIHHALLTGQQGEVIFVEGESGTGKTVLNSSLFYELCMETIPSDSTKKAWNCHLVVNHDEQLKVYKDIAYKIALKSKDAKFITKPTTFINQYYLAGNWIKKPDVDVVFVDEAHLLWSQGKQSYQNSNMIEDLRKIAKVVVLMFDMRQVLHIQDYWDPDYIDNIRQEAADKKKTVGVSYYYKLEDQLRIKGSADTVQWIKNFTDNHVIGKIPVDPEYSIKVFDNPFVMEKQLRKRALNKKGDQRLSRIIATFDWSYTDGKPRPDGTPWMVSIATSKGLWQRPWNNQIPIPKAKARTAKKLSWAEQPQTIDEVGSTFTIQGSDLNIAAVILGPSVKYDGSRIYFDATLCADKNATNRRTISTGKKISIAETLIDNAVNVLMKRGTDGLYIYACDKELRNALIAASK